MSGNRGEWCRIGVNGGGFVTRKKEGKENEKRGGLLT